MTYSIRQAARAAGRSKATIHRAVNNGKISAAKDEATGEWRIDPAELHRVFPPVSHGHVPDGSVKQREAAGDASETAILRVLLEQEREERQRERTDKDAVIADLRVDRDQWREQAQRLALTDQRAKAPDVIAMPPSAAPAPAVSYDTIAPAPPARVSPATTSTDAPAEPAPAADNQPQQYPARAVVKKAPKRTPKTDVGWWRKMIGGR